MNVKRAARNNAVTEKPSSRSAIQNHGNLVLAAGICMAAICLAAIRHIFPPSSAWPQGWFNPFDAGIVTYVNQLADSWRWLNPTARIFTDHNLLKDGPIVFLFWIAFFPRTGSAEEILERRRKIAATVSLALFGVVLARILALVFPFRERPLRTAALHFQAPHILKPSVLYGWSSFPSDHAVLLVTLAAGLLMTSRLLGSIALFYTFSVNIFLRVYLGLHWPTDLLAGVAIGVALASIVSIPAYRNFVWRLVTKCWQLSPGIFAAFIFVLSYEIVDMFEGPLTLAKAVLKHHLR
jgi:undecaprenyl-diphosphatase